MSGLKCFLRPSEVAILLKFPLPLTYWMYRCEHCSAVFTTRRQWRRHSQVHWRFACRKCGHNCTDYAALQQHLAEHLATTSTQTGPSGASLAAKVLTPSKHRVKRAVSYAEYKAFRLEDPLRLLESSDEDTSGKDPRSQRWASAS